MRDETKLFRQGEPMVNQTQVMLDTAQQCMEEAQRLTHSGPAGTRVLQAFVILLSKRFLPDEQHRQVATILALHDECLSQDGQAKTKGADQVYRAP
jgi:hypothetical protein